MSKDVLDSLAELDQVIYVISHDLRGPASVAAQFADLLERRMGDVDDRQRRCLDGIHCAIEELDRRLEGLLMVSRARQMLGKVGPQDMAARLQDGAAERGLACLVTGELPTVYADEGRIHRLMGLLLDNVLHHAGPDATARLSHQDGSFHLADDGPGLNDKARDRAFVPFRPLPMPDSGRQGIGLSVSRAICRHMGGDMTIADGPEGGAIVTFQLPTRPEDAPSPMV